MQPSQSSSMPPPSTKTEYTVQHIRSALLRGDIRPGDPLSISAIAEELGISATPVREAIKVLQAQGLVTQEPHKTGTVAELSHSDAEELYRIRARLEGLAASFAARNPDQQLLSGLEDLQADMRDVLREEDLDRFSSLNTDWHFLVYNAAETTWLREFIVRLWVRVPWRQMWGVSARYEESLHQHDEILRALGNGDADGAERLMAEHILSGLDTLRALLADAEASSSAASSKDRRSA